MTSFDLVLRYDCIAASDNDEEILALLVDLGVASVFPSSTGKKDWTAFIGVEDFPTHWISFAKHTGYAKPEDNGYQMVALPKAGFTREQADRMFDTMMRFQFRSGHLPKRQWVTSKLSHN